MVAAGVSGGKGIGAWHCDEDIPRTNSRFKKLATSMSVNKRDCRISDGSLACSVDPPFFLVHRTLTFTVDEEGHEWLSVRHRVDRRRLCTRRSGSWLRAAWC